MVDHKHQNDQEQKTEHKSFAHPEERRDFPHGHAEILDIGGAKIGRLTFDPGWRWSTDVKPIAHTNSCEAPHMQYHVSGRLAIRMDDGTEFIAGPGDITSLPKGHDARSWRRRYREFPHARAENPASPSGCAKDLCSVFCSWSF